MFKHTLFILLFILNSSSIQSSTQLNWTVNTEQKTDSKISVTLVPPQNEVFGIYQIPLSETIDNEVIQISKYKGSQFVTLYNQKSKFIYFTYFQCDSVFLEIPSSLNDKISFDKIRLVKGRRKFFKSKFFMYTVGNHVQGKELINSKEVKNIHGLLKHAKNEITMNLVFSELLKHFWSTGDRHVTLYNPNFKFGALHGQSLIKPKIETYFHDSTYYLKIFGTVEYESDFIDSIETKIAKEIKEYQNIKNVVIDIDSAQGGFVDLHIALCSGFIEKDTFYGLTLYNYRVHWIVRTNDSTVLSDYFGNKSKKKFLPYIKSIEHITLILGRNTGSAAEILAHIFMSNSLTANLEVVFSNGDCTAGAPYSNFITSSMFSTSLRYDIRHILNKDGARMDKICVKE